MNDLALAQAQGPSPFGPLLIMALIFGFFYFLVIRPQQKREKEKTTLRENLKKGDDVVTVGGVYGRVVELKEGVVILEIAQNVRVRFERKAIEALARGKKEPQESTKR